MSDQNKKAGKPGFNPLGLCFGVSIGLCFGTAMGNMAAGICMGLGVGLCFCVALGNLGAQDQEKNAEKEEDESK